MGLTQTVAELVLDGAGRDAALRSQAAKLLKYWHNKERPEDFFSQNRESPVVADAVFTKLISARTEEQAAHAFEVMGPNYVTIERLVNGLRIYRHPERVLKAYGPRVLPLLWVAPKTDLSWARAKKLIRGLNSTNIPEIVFVEVDRYANSVSNLNVGQMIPLWDGIVAEHPELRDQLLPDPHAYARSDHAPAQPRLVMQFIYQARHSHFPDMRKKMNLSERLMNEATRRTIELIYGITSVSSSGALSGSSAQS